VQNARLSESIASGQMMNLSLCLVRTWNNSAQFLSADFAAIVNETYLWLKQGTWRWFFRGHAICLF
jgi:hypothetical protein